MYKKTSHLSQRRASQQWLADLQGQDWEELPPLEQRANLVRAKQAINAKIIASAKGSPERRELGLVAFELDQRINAIRPKCKGPSTLPKFFMDVARERMNPFPFKTFMSEATNRAKQDEA